jgi:hypothetical protein
MTVGIIWLGENEMQIVCGESNLDVRLGFAKQYPQADLSRIEYTKLRCSETISPYYFYGEIR